MELAEAKLSAGIDIKQLFVLQHVNRVFRDTIMDSRDLAIRMFFRFELKAGDVGEVKVNPLFLEDFFGDGRFDRLSVITSYAIDYLPDASRGVTLFAHIICMPGADLDN